MKPGIGGTIHDPTDPVGRLLLNVLAMVATSSAPEPAKACRSREKGEQAMTPKNERKNQTESHVTQKSCLHELVSAETGTEGVVHQQRHHVDTSVDTVHTPFGRTNSHQLLPQAPRNRESRPKIWKRNSRRSCHHHNRTA